MLFIRQRADEPLDRRPIQDVGPFTAWPAGKDGYAVLDLRNKQQVAGPFSTPKDALDEAARWNRRHTPRSQP